MPITRVDEISVNDDGIYVVQNEKLYKIDKPSSGFGKTKLITQHGKIVRVETTISEFFPSD